MRLLRRLAAVAGILVSVGAAPLAAQEFPNKVVRITVGFVPGGGADAVARDLGARLQDAWGQSVVVENRAGANGTVATAALAKSPARRSYADADAVLACHQSDDVPEPALRHHEGRHSGQPRGIVAAGAGGQPVVRGGRREEPDCARQDEARGHPLFDPRHRLDPSSVHGAVELAERDQAGPGAVPRRRSGGDRRHRESAAIDHGEHGADPPARAEQAAQAARGDVGEANRRVARCSDLRRGGGRRLRVRAVVRADRARRHAAGAW